MTGIFEKRFLDGVIGCPFFLAGEGEELNTNTIFQDFGIFERSEVLRNKGVPLPNSLPVYTANHYRAVLDMLYRWISDNQYPAHLEIDAWFDTPEQIAYLMEKTKALYPFLTSTQQTLLTRWIESNTPR